MAWLTITAKSLWPSVARVNALAAAQQLVRKFFNALTHTAISMRYDTIFITNNKKELCESNF